MTIPVSRLDHAVFWVSDVEKVKGFYQRVFGMKEVVGQSGMVLLRAGSDEQHHDIGLFQAASDIPRPPRSKGLYHLAWKVDRIEDLAMALETLEAEGALTGASDHGATKSVYGVDPDGNEFEIVFTLPRPDWGVWESGGTVAPLNLEEEIKRYGRSEDEIQK